MKMVDANPNILKPSPTKPSPANTRCIPSSMPQTDHGTVSQSQCVCVCVCVRSG